MEQLPGAEQNWFQQNAPPDKQSKEYPGIPEPLMSPRTPPGGYKVGDTAVVGGKTMHVTGIDAQGRPQLELQPAQPQQPAQQPQGNWFKQNAPPSVIDVDDAKVEEVGKKFPFLSSNQRRILAAHPELLQPGQQYPWLPDVLGHTPLERIEAQLASEQAAKGKVKITDKQQKIIAQGERVGQTYGKALEKTQKYAVEPFDKLAKAASQKGADIAEKVLLEPPGLSQGAAGVMRTQTPALHGVARGIGGTVGGVAGDPRYWPLMLSGGEELAALHDMLGLGFTVQMAHGAVQDIQAYREIRDRSDVPLDQKYEMLTGAVISALMAAHQVKGTLSSGKQVPGPMDKRVADEVRRLTPEQQAEIFRRVQDRLRQKGEELFPKPLESKMEAMPAEPSTPDHPGFTVKDLRGQEKTPSGAPVILDVPVLDANERQALRWEQMREETYALLEQERQQRVTEEEDRRKRFEDEIGEQKRRELKITERRTLAPKGSQETHDATMQRYHELGDAMDAKAQEKLYVDAADRARSLLEKKPRGKALTPEEKDFLKMWDERKRLLNLVDPREPETTEFGRQRMLEEAGLAEREQKLRDAAERLNKDASRAKTPDESKERGEAADEAIRMAEDIKTRVDRQRAEREAASEKQTEYPAGSPVPLVANGRETEVRLPDGRKLGAKYAIVKAEDLVTSHDPMSFGWDERYQPRRLQPRDYEKNKEAQAGVIAGGQNFEVNAVHNTDDTGHNGPPVILADGRVAGGNGRAMRLMRAYKEGNPEAIRDHLKEVAEMFGIDPDSIPSADQHPVLVRVLDETPTDLAELINLGQDLNRTETRGFTQAEQSVMSAERISQDTMNWLSLALDRAGEEMSIRDLMRVRGNELVEKLMEDGLFEPTKRAQFVTAAGELTEDAKRLFENALLGKVIDDADLIATMPPHIKNKLFRALASLSKIKAADPAWDFTDYLQEAIRNWKRIEAVGNTLDAFGKKDDPVSEKWYEYQAGKMIPEPPDHPAVVALTKLLDEPGLKVKEAFARYADEIEGKQEGLAFRPPANPRDAFNQHIAEKQGVEVKDGEWGSLRSKPAVEPVPQEVTDRDEADAELGKVPDEELQADYQTVRELYGDDDPVTEAYKAEIDRRERAAAAAEPPDLQAEPVQPEPLPEPPPAEPAAAAPTAERTPEDQAKVDIQKAINTAIRTEGPLTEEKLRDILSKHPKYSPGKVNAAMDVWKRFAEKYAGKSFDQWLQDTTHAVEIMGEGPKVPTAMEIPTGILFQPLEPEHEQMIREGGGIPVGLQSGFGNIEAMAMFNHPETKSTVALPVSQVTVENVRAKLADHKTKIAAEIEKWKGQPLYQAEWGAGFNPEQLESWARAAGRRLSIEDYGQQMSLFGAPENVYRLKNSRGESILVTQTQMDALREKIPGIGARVSDEGTRQGSLFGQQLAPLPESEAQGGLFGMEPMPEQQSLGMGEEEAFLRANDMTFMPGADDMFEATQELKKELGRAPTTDEVVERGREVTIRRLREQERRRASGEPEILPPEEDFDLSDPSQPSLNIPQVIEGVLSAEDREAREQRALPSDLAILNEKDPGRQQLLLRGEKAGVDIATAHYRFMPTEELRNMVEIMERDQQTLADSLRELQGPEQGRLTPEEFVREVVPKDVTGFASGTNRPADIRGFVKAGVPIGADVSKLSEPAIKEIESLAGKNYPVFLDSGAFSEIKGEPITEEDWLRRLAVYDRLADKLGKNLTVVAPDKVGDQAETMARLKRFAEQIKGLESKGVRVVIPLQRGARTPMEFWIAANEVVDFNMVPGLPMNKAAMPIPEVLDFINLQGPASIHLLGYGLNNPHADHLLRVLREGSPEMQITMDANALRAHTGEGRGVTEAQRAGVSREGAVEGHFKGGKLGGQVEPLPEEKPAAEFHRAKDGTNLPLRSVRDGSLLNAAQVSAMWAAEKARAVRQHREPRFWWAQPAETLEQRADRAANMFAEASKERGGFVAAAENNESLKDWKELIDSSDTDPKLQDRLRAAYSAMTDPNDPAMRVEFENAVVFGTIGAANSVRKNKGNWGALVRVETLHSDDPLDPWRITYRLKEDHPSRLKFENRDEMKKILKDHALLVTRARRMNKQQFLESVTPAETDAIRQSLGIDGGDFWHSVKTGKKTWSEAQPSLGLEALPSEVPALPEEPAAPVGYLPGVPSHEKAQEMAVRSAAREKANLPLFADQIEPTSPDKIVEAAEKNRERIQQFRLNSLAEAKASKEAVREVVPPEVFDAFERRRSALPPSSEYEAGFWRSKAEAYLDHEGSPRFSKEEISDLFKKALDLVDGKVPLMEFPWEEKGIKEAVEMRVAEMSRKFEKVKELKEPTPYWQTVRGITMTEGETQPLRDIGWTPEVGQDYHPGHPWADPRVYPPAEEVGVRERDTYWTEPEHWGHPFNKKLPKNPAERTRYLRAALEHSEKRRDIDMKRYEELRKAAMEDPDNPILGINSGLGLKYAHLTAVNSIIDAIRSHLGSGPATLFQQRDILSLTNQVLGDVIKNARAKVYLAQAIREQLPHGFRIFGEADSMRIPNPTDNDIKWYAQVVLDNYVRGEAQPFDKKTVDAVLQAVKPEDLRTYEVEKARWLSEGDVPWATLQQGKKGAVQFLEDGKALVHLMEHADISTVFHEFAHIARRNLKPEDRGIVEKWLKVTESAWDRDHEEKFARAFERYLYDGQAPTPELKSVFARIRDWMLEVYHAVKGSSINIKIPDDVRKVFDRMVGAEDGEAPAPLEKKPQKPQGKSEGQKWLTEELGSKLDKKWYDEQVKHVMRPALAEGGHIPSFEELKRLYAEFLDKPDHEPLTIQEFGHNIALNTGPGYWINKARNESKTRTKKTADRSNLEKAIDKEAATIQESRERKGDELTPEERLAGEQIAEGGANFADQMERSKIQVFPDAEGAIKWAKANAANLEGIKIFTLPDGRAFTHYVPKDPDVLYQETDPVELDRRIRLIDERLSKLIPEPERLKLGKMRQELMAQKNQGKIGFMPPVPGEKPIRLWTPEGEVEVGGSRGKADTERGAPDVPAPLPEPEGTPRVSEPAGQRGRGAEDERPGRGVRRPAAGRGGEREGGEHRRALPDVKPAELDAPARERGEPVYGAAEWTEAVKRLGLPPNAPAPTVRIPSAIRRMLIFPGQPEIVESALSGLKQHDAYIVATGTGSGKTYTGSAILSQIYKPGMRALVLTTSKDLIHQRRKGWIAVARDFDVDLGELPAGESNPEPGAYVTTYATAIGRTSDVDQESGDVVQPGIDTTKWDVIIADEIDDARKWFSSQRGAMMKRMGENSGKIVYMSATPFHTALEIGHMTKLGLWRDMGFDRWGFQFGVRRDAEGNYTGGNAPKKLIKLREQLIERGQFIGIEKNLEGFNASFAMVPLNPGEVQAVKNINEAFAAAEEYFRRRQRKSMIRAVKGNAATYIKKYLERSRLPQAVELGKKLEAEGWKVIIFSETRTERDKVFDFLREPDEALGGRISELLPPLPGVPEALAEHFGETMANYSGPHSAARTAAKDDFNDDTTKHIYVSYAAGGRGVSLHDESGVKPRAVIYLGPPYSGIMFDQAIGRAWRYGTKSNVHAIFLTSNAMPEINMIAGKVAPRMSSLRAMVSGIDDQDRFVNTLHALDSEREQQIGYELGNNVNFDPREYEQITNTHAVQSWKDVKIGPASEAMNKGMKMPETGVHPGVMRLFQDDEEMEPPEDFNLPEEKDAERENDRLKRNMEEGGRIPGDDAGEPLPGPVRMQMADYFAAKAREEAAASQGDVDKVGVVQSQWKRDRGFLRHAFDVVQDSRAAKAAKAVDLYMFTNGRRVIRILGKDGGNATAANTISRMIPEYHVVWGNVSGPWVKRYFDILKENDISKTRKVSFRDPKTGEMKEVNEHHNMVFAKEGKQPPANARIARAVQQVTQLFQDVKNTLAKENVATEIFEDGGRRYIPFAEQMDDPNYWPRKYDLEYEIRTTDPETGEVHVAKLRDLVGDRMGAATKEKMIRGIMRDNNLSRAAVEDWLASRHRDTPLIGNVERARQYDLPYYRTDANAAVEYLEGAGETVARTRIFGQRRQKLERLIESIPGGKQRRGTREVMDSLLAGRYMEDDTRALMGVIADWAVVTKMGFSAVKALGHSAWAGMYSNTRSYARGMFEGITNYQEVHDRSIISGAVLEQYKNNALKEYGTRRGSMGSKFLDYVQFHRAYEFGRMISDATARVYLERTALPKLMKGKSTDFYRRALKEIYLLDDKSIDDAIAAGSWSEADLNRAGKALADKTMFTNDPTELPPAWRARSENEIADFTLGAVRAVTLLKGYSFKVGAMLRERLIDEARKGNFRPWIPFVLVIPELGEMIGQFNSIWRSNKQQAEDMLTPGGVFWRIAEDIAHMTGMSTLEMMFEAIAHPHSKGRTDMARTTYEFFLGPFASDLVHTVIQLPYELTNAKTDQARMNAVKRWLRSTFPLSKVVVPPPERKGVGSQGSRDYHMTPIPTE